MNINFRQPRYVLPLLLLPFLCLFFYVWHGSAGKSPATARLQDSLNPNVGNVSGIIRKKQLADKLHAYRNAYKEADGLSAVAVIPAEKSGIPGYPGSDALGQQRRLDSLRQMMRIHANAAPDPFPGGTHAIHTTGVYDAVAATRQREAARPQMARRETDPMNVFRQQMAIMDSVTRQNDPAWKEEQRKQLQADQAEKIRKSMPRLSVTKAGNDGADFNTVLPADHLSFINAVIDENVTGYAGSRIRLKLLDDIRAGGQLIPKDTYLYAQVTGFSGQRVMLAVTSILNGGSVLPVRLDVYDQDGLPGLYVPASAFRDFTKDLGGSSVQGVTLDGGTGTNQFMMSTLDKFFQSTSSAVAGIIRKNKAKLKFNSFIYLIDPDALQKAQKAY